VEIDVTPLVRPDTSDGVLLPLVLQHFAAPETTAHPVCVAALTALTVTPQDTGPVKTPVDVLKVTPAGSVPV
jgi:hypothetical protein